MKLHPSLLLVAMVSLATCAHSLPAATMGNPVNDLTQKLQADPRERAEAGRRVEDFVMKPDSAGKSFVSADVDQAVFGAVAREWARKTDASRLAILLFVSTPSSKTEPRLRASLTSWTNNQIKNLGEINQLTAFLEDATAQAGRVLDDQIAAERSGKIQDQAPIPVPRAGRSIELAHKLQEQLGSAGSMSSDLNIDPPVQNTSTPVDALAQKLRDDPKEREEAGKHVESFLLKPDSSGKSFVSSNVDKAVLAAVAHEWARKADTDQLAALLLSSTPESKAEPRLRAALSSWTGQINSSGEVNQILAFLNDATTQARLVLYVQSENSPKEIKTKRTAVKVPSPLLK